MITFKELLQTWTKMYFGNGIVINNQNNENIWKKTLNIFEIIQGRKLGSGAIGIGCKVIFWCSEILVQTGEPEKDKLLCQIFILLIKYFENLKLFII